MVFFIGSVCVSCGERGEGIRMGREMEEGRDTVSYQIV